MFSGFDVSDLPDEPELAFLAFEQAARDHYQRRMANRGDEHQDGIMLEYLNNVVAAAEELEIEDIKDVEIPTFQTMGYDKFVEFRTKVDFFRTKINIRYVAKQKRGSVKLDSVAKSKIHHLIDQIREHIERSDLPEDKRDSLLRKLNDFAKAVDQNRTALQAAMGIYLYVCAGIGAGVESLRPVKELIDSVAGLLGKAKEAEEAFERLPAPVEQKRLEAPKAREE